MDQFQISLYKRIFSRIAFYSVATLILWLMGRVAPAEGWETSIPTDEQLGAAKVYINVPIEIVRSEIPGFRISEQKN